MNKKKTQAINSIMIQVLKENKPSDAEKSFFTKNANSLLKIINAQLKKDKIQATAVVGGSFAKGTYTKRNFDCDIFVKFEMLYSNFDISKLLEKSLDKIPEIKFKKIHGSRDYFECNYNEMHFEIVPVLKVRNIKDIKNVTDASIFHVKWVIDNIQKNKKLVDDIIVTKLFLKAANIYGAESFIRGFSGHVVDIMIIYYGGFIQLLEAASKWKDKEIIDINKVYKNPLKELNKSKIDSPLIVIDPIQKDRNAAAGLSEESYNALKKLAKEFLKNPDISFFKKKPFSIDELKKELKKENSLLYSIIPVKGSKDIVGTKMLKVFERIAKQLELNNFNLKSKGWYWNEIVGNQAEAYYWFVFKDKVFSKEEERIGPPINRKNFVEIFKKKHKNTYVKNNRICAIVKRKYPNPEAIIAQLQHEKFFMNIKDMKKVDI